MTKFHNIHVIGTKAGVKILVDGKAIESDFDSFEIYVDGKNAQLQLTRVESYTTGEENVSDPEPTFQDALAASIDLKNFEPMDLEAIAIDKNKPIDTGKIKALYRAGWTTDDIADDVGCSSAIVREKLITMKGNGEL